MGGRIEDWKVDQFEKFIKRGGTKVSPEHQEARMNICNSCEKKVIMKVHSELPELETCGACECPLSTKSWMLTYFRKIGQEDQSLTPKELIELTLFRKINPSKFHEVIIKCDHPDGNKWLEVDNNFK